MQNGTQSQGDLDVTRQLEELRAQAAVNRSDIDALQVEQHHSSERADASDTRADEDRRRIDDLATNAEIDRGVIAELKAAGLVNAEMVGHLQTALRASRRIGAAVGIVMASCKVSEDEAFEMLRGASQHANRKLRVLADEIVETGDVSELPAVKVDTHEDCA